MTRTTAIPDGIVTMEQLADLPEPERCGPRHRPFSHFRVMESVLGVLDRQGIPVAADGVKLELTNEGRRLDARLLLASQEQAEEARQRMIAKRESIDSHVFVPAAHQEVIGAALSITHANDLTRALRAEAAIQVYVCTNLAVGSRGSGPVMKRKHTGDEPLEARLERLIRGAIAGFEGLFREVDAMSRCEITDYQAKALILDGFRLKYPLPKPSDILKVTETYLAHATPDVSGRDLWSLHNAFTRCMRDLPEWRQVEAGRLLTALFTQEALSAGEVDPHTN